MQRIIVDFPDPEGPQMTIFSPLRTLRFTSRRTWKDPYHLCTPTSSTAISEPDWAEGEAATALM